MGSDGTLSVTLRWGDSEVDLDLYLTASTCNGYPPTDCTILARSDRTQTSNECLTRAVRRGESLRVWVDNFDRTRSQGYTIELALLAPPTFEGGEHVPLRISAGAARGAPSDKHKRR